MMEHDPDKQKLIDSLTEVREDEGEDVLEREDEKPKPSRLLFWLIVFIVVLVVSYAVPAILGPGRTAPMSRAKGTLRSIGSSMLAYSDRNDYGHFGTFDALIENGFIAEGVTLNNFIDRYELTWEISSTRKIRTEYEMIEVMNRFTVIAWPEDRCPGYLNTFGVTEDGVVRVYNPDGGNAREDVTSWDPIL